ncbi:MAG: hypothetical protein FD177_2228 [Desulfovibrionaceae bacterium]|nr:MAG: hypothetical protein FD177_2228 [Desulfovibrionaceae bacterium]
MTRVLSIALIGTRGVPAKYGGFETCVHEIGRRLAQRGHSVTVYCRCSYYMERTPEWEGVRRIFLPNIRMKTLDTLSHTFLSCWHALFMQYDVHMVFNAANSLMLFPLRLFGKRIAVNTDGLEWRRSKWNRLGKSYFKAAEKLSCFIANRIVSDSKGIHDYYLKTHGVDSSEIAYGAYVQQPKSPDRLKELGLVPGGYFLQITRFEPENYPLLTIEAYNRLNTDKKLVLVGGNPYGGDYVDKIMAAAGENIILPGFIYDQELLGQLWAYCHAYIHGNSVGGTNPALLQTMAAGCLTIASDIPFNHDVLQEFGIYYTLEQSSLAEMMQWSLDHIHELDGFKQGARQRVLKHYSWEHITDQYEALFYDLLDNKYPWRLLRASGIDHKKSA